MDVGEMQLRRHHMTARGLLLSYVKWKNADRL